MCPAWSTLLHKEEIHSSGQKKDDILAYATSDILCQIDAPIPTKQRGHYSISSEDVVKIEKAAQW